MKHATPKALAQIGSLLGGLRRLPDMVERRPGVFYVKGKAFLHFHEDPKGIFADIKIRNDWKRFAVDGARDRSEVLKLAASTLPAVGAPPRPAARRRDE